jgi:formate/nitrite transporter FocA (FNT family)
MTSLSRRTVFILGLVCLVILSAFVLEYVLTAIPSRPFGHTQTAHVVGRIGLGNIIGKIFHSWISYKPKGTFYANAISD